MSQKQIQEMDNSRQSRSSKTNSKLKIDGYLVLETQDDPHNKNFDDSDDNDYEVENQDEHFRNINLLYNYNIKDLDIQIKTFHNIHDIENVRKNSKDGSKSKEDSFLNTKGKCNLPLVQILRVEKVKDSMSNHIMYTIELIFNTNEDGNDKATTIEITKRFSDFVSQNEEYCKDVNLIGHVIPKRPQRSKKIYLQNIVQHSVQKLQNITTEEEDCETFEKNRRVSIVFYLMKILNHWKLKDHAITRRFLELDHNESLNFSQISNLSQSKDIHSQSNFDKLKTSALGMGIFLKKQTETNFESFMKNIIQKPTDSSKFNVDQLTNILENNFIMQSEKHFFNHMDDIIQGLMKSLSVISDHHFEQKKLYESIAAAHQLVFRFKMENDDFNENQIIEFHKTKIETHNKLIYLLKEFRRDVEGCLESIKRIRKFHVLIEEKENNCKQMNVSSDYNYESFKEEIDNMKKLFKFKEVCLRKELSIARKNINNNMSFILTEFGDKENKVMKSQHNDMKCLK